MVNKTEYIVTNHLKSFIGTYFGLFSTRIFFLYLFLFIALFHCGNARAKNLSHYNRHFILIVDQTPMNINNKELLFESLESWLEGNTDKALSQLNKHESLLPTINPFNPQSDQLSLFAFGLAGNIHIGDYHRIWSNVYNKTKSPEEVYNDLYKSYVLERDNFQNDRNKHILHQFFQDKVKSLFDGNDELCKRCSAQSCISLSNYVYPLILNYIQSEVTASEYIVMVLSDFVSGATNVGAGADKDRIRELFGNNEDYISFFHSQIAHLGEPFQQVNLFKMVVGNGQGSDDIQISGTRLVVSEALNNPPLFITSNVTMRQMTGLNFLKGSNNFELGKTIVTFNKDRSTEVQRVEVVVSDAEGNQIGSKLVSSSDYSYDEKRREYTIMPQSVKLNKSSFDGDYVTIDYQFYTMSKKEDGTNLLPFLMKSSRQIQKDDISFVKQATREKMTILTAVLILLALLGLLILRGRRKDLEVTNGKFAQKYMNVTDSEGAVELPCWFHHEGEKSKSIRVTARVKKRPFSIGGKTRLFVRLQDQKPEGFKYYIDGKNASEFIEVKSNRKRFKNERKNKKDNEYSFNINIEILPSINPSELHTCGVKVDYYIESSLFGFFTRQDFYETSDDLEFYFLNDLGTAWVGFDPGTTGSCVSYGCTGGSLDNPNIKMVTVRNNEIIPSKLVLSKDFGETPVDKLEPGRDYEYGMEAESNWEASNRAGLPCFQSIKKLLGYKNSADDMIEVKWNSGTRRLTGLQLAHLLVKGLKKELDNNVRKLSQNDNMRYVGKSGHARRAVVAIPNNYTLPKITDMVNSVRMLGSFDEVRYIYESEGILFNYFRKNYKTQKKGEETIVVYDMGGATINLSIFRVEYIENNGTIYYDVHTLGRIGYAVGGDNIDVAIMEYLFTLKDNEEVSKNNKKHVDNTSKEADRRHDYQLKHKAEILKSIVDLKKDIVKAVDDENLEGNKLENQVTYEAAVRDILGTYCTLPDDALDFIKEDYHHHAITDIQESDSMKTFVMLNVKDAVEEIMKYPEIERLTQIDTLIFAGRSTMFPGIQEVVKDTIKRRFKSIYVYDGFKADEIKTSVSYGACWYGIYNSLVTLDNSRLSCAYGFKLTKGGRSELNVLLNQNDIFDLDGTVSNSVEVNNRFDSDGNVVDFYQVMGSGQGNDLFSENNRHKVNFIGSIDVSTATKEITMSVDRRNVVSCTVAFDTGDVSTYKDLNVVGRDITKENDWAYVFAATTQPQSSIQQNTGNLRHEPIKQPKQNPKTSSGGGAERV